jgi:hypothetical protein
VEPEQDLRRANREWWQDYRNSVTGRVNGGRVIQDKGSVREITATKRAHTFSPNEVKNQINKELRNEGFIGNEKAIQLEMKLKRALLQGGQYQSTAEYQGSENCHGD